MAKDRERTASIEEAKITHDPISEGHVIAAALVDRQVADDLIAKFEPEHFFEPKHRTAWVAMKELTRRGLTIEMSSLSKVGNVDVEYLRMLVEMNPKVPANLNFLIDTIYWDYTRVLTVQGPLGELVRLLADPRSDVTRIKSLAKSVTESFDTYRAHTYFRDNEELLREVKAELDAAREGHSICGYGIPNLDNYETLDDQMRPVARMIPGAAPGMITCITGLSGHGKALAMDTPIPTPDGWSTMAELRAGDRVIDENGEPCNVVAVTEPMHDRICYNVRFSDGTSIVADAEHLWQTKDRRMMGASVIRTTREIGATLLDRDLESFETLVDSRIPITSFRHSIVDKVASFERTRFITRVDAVASRPVKCIQVDSPSKLYLAGPGMVPTHNSTITANIVLAQARLKKKVLYGAWEMTSCNTLQLLACMSCGLERRRLFLKRSDGGFSEEEGARLLEASRRIQKYVKFMDVPFDRKRTTKKKSNEQNLDIIEDHIRKSGCDVFVADLWARCLVETKPEDEVLALQRQQTIAQATKVHCILAHQQRLKDMEKRANPRPTREGNKGSAIWVEVTDTMIGVYNPSQVKDVPANIMELIVLKQRYGKFPQAIEFDWDPARAVLSGGKTVPYDAGGDGSTMQEFFDEQAAAGKKRR